MSKESNLKNYLDSWDVKYISYSMNPDLEKNFQANEICKTLIVKMDDKYAILLMADSESINLEHIRMLSGARSIRIVGEDEYHQSFPDTEYGALSLLGSINNVRVYCSRKLFKQPDIYFNIDSDHEIIKIPMDEFIRRTTTIIGSFD
jgi:prolyl-tRNA editing enzyme YbaK/EbsC (Cys-tRNA(Pro) deacylase)